ncbi:MAG TPA: hypothetical protein VFN49_08555 [Candidatus Aquilonibacter sp.]|nr:hypothetical protein [Candidatus Aquilonibacter sp.]
MRVYAALAALMLVAAVGCSHKTTVETDHGPATVTTSNDNKTVTVESKDAKVTVGGEIDASKLGAPLYPGAEKSEGSYSMQSAQESGSMATFSTKDDFDKVYEYYKAHMPQGSEKMKMSNGGESVASFSVIDPKKGETSVMITAKDGQTQILISHKDAK